MPKPLDQRLLDSRPEGQWTAFWRLVFEAADTLPKEREEERKAGETKKARRG